MARESPGGITQQLAHLYFAILAFLLRQENIFSSPIAAQRRNDRAMQGTPVIFS
jgi:hypothetical protein